MRKALRWFWRALFPERLRPYILFGCLVVISLLMFFDIAEVSGNSMKPVISDGDFLLILKNTPLHRTDVVLITDPQKPDSEDVKRLVGMPGDMLSMDRVVSIGHDSGSLNSLGKLDEPYLPPKTWTWPIPSSPIVRLRSGSYFVLGDNRDISKDSRDFGPLKGSDIKGKVVAIYWPKAHWKIFW